MTPKKGCKDIGIKKSQFVAITQFFLIYKIYVFIVKVIMREEEGSNLNLPSTARYAIFSWLMF